MSDGGSRNERVRILLTGSGGFVGHHVKQAITAGEFGEAGIVEPEEDWDVRHPEAVRELVAAEQPTGVLHLAAQSFVPRSFEDPRETFEINLLGTLNLLQALSAEGFEGRLIYVSSGDVYGAVPDAELPVDEARKPAPRNPYAASKLAAEELCLQWRRAQGMDVIIARPFNHVGPGQHERFVLPAVARQISAIAAGAAEPVLDVGDVDVSRDFTDVRDVVSAYAAMFRRGVAGRTYVVGSGRESTIAELIERLCRLAGVSPSIRTLASRTRPAEQRRMRSDPSLLKGDTGWEPTIPMSETLTDILEQFSARRRSGR